MPFLSPHQQCESIEGNISHSRDLLTPSSPGIFFAVEKCANESIIVTVNSKRTRRGSQRQLKDAGRTDGSVEKAEDKSEDDENSVPVTSAGHSRYAEVHEDDRLRHGS